ncbi:TPA: cellulose biosynthesis protein BcsE [Stenotrophomonas maltophilia]|nr:cellulose biosynthesis protein BcsE [Stenotrophomonas maltophilia]
MTAAHLAIAGLPSEFVEMRGGGLYWVVAAGSAPTDLLGAGVLSTAAALQDAVLVTLGRGAEPMLSLLADEQGPLRLRLFQRSHHGMQQALRGLPQDLPRVASAATGLSLVQFPVAALDGWDDTRLARWCERLQRWAGQAGQIVLLLCHGEVATLAPRLLPLNRACAGVAQLHPHRGALQLLLHYWSNSHGVVAQRSFGVLQEGTGLRHVAEADSGDEAASLASGSDRDVFLAQADVLEGAPPLSAAWRLYDGWAGLLPAALQAREATVVLAINENAQVDALARLLHRLRRERGTALKLVVRELQPCLRYADERLLMQCGCSLVVPADTPLPRLLTLLETVQRQRWQGQLADDPEPLIRAHRPPSLSGLVNAARFRQIAAERIDQDGSAVESAVLALQPVAGLRAEQTLQQLRIRRQGDLACIYRGQVRLFLFGCRRDAVEQALGNLFRLPWRELFDGYQRLAEYDIAAMNPSGSDPDAELLPEAPAALPAVAPVREAPAVVAPKPLRLGDTA